MDIKSTTVFNFSHPHGGINYAFSIGAETQQAAIKILRDGLQSVIDALNQAEKANTKPN